MATVFLQRRERRNRTSYQVYYKDPATGRNRYYKTFRKYRKAQEAINRLRELIDNGKIQELRKSKSRITPLRFRELAESLKSEWEDRVQRDDLAETTHQNYISILGGLQEKFGNLLACEISSQEVKRFRDETAKGSSNVNANRDLFVLKQVFKMGIEVNSLLDDPSASISYLSEKEHERNRFLLPKGIDMLVEASRRMPKAKHYLPALIYLGSEHGASKQEALSLKWSDIDFEFGGKGLIRFFRTKNGRERTEYLMPRTRNALLELKKHQAWMRHRKRIKDKGGGYVFSHMDGAPLNNFQSAWDTVRRITKIEDFHFHDLRHTFCSNVLLAGANLKDVKEMIGHQDLAMTDRYSHITSARKLALQDSLAKHYMTPAIDGPDELARHTLDKSLPKRKRAN